MPQVRNKHAGAGVTASNSNPGSYASVEHPRHPENLAHDEGDYLRSELRSRGLAGTITAGPILPGGTKTATYTRESGSITSVTYDGPSGITIQTQWPDHEVTTPRYTSRDLTLGTALAKQVRAATAWRFVEEYGFNSNPLLTVNSASFETNAKGEDLLILRTTGEDVDMDDDFRPVLTTSRINLSTRTIEHKDERNSPYFDSDDDLTEVLFGSVPGGKTARDRRELLEEISDAWNVDPDYGY